MDHKAPYEVKVAVVIDDDPDIRSLLEDVLMLSGYSVVPVETARDGIEAVRTFSPTLTLMDVSMPGMDGFAATREIREISDTFLVIVSGRTEEIDVVEGFASGADDYVFKPFRIRELRSRLDAGTRRARAAVTAAAAAVASESVLAASASVLAASQASAAGATADAETVQEVEFMDRLADAVGAESASRPVHATPAWRPGQALPSFAQPAPSSSQYPVAHRQTNGYAVPTLAPGRIEANGAVDTITHAEDDSAVDLPTVLTHGALSLDRTTGEVRVGPRRIDLTEREFALLATLLEHRDRVRSTSSLVLAMRGQSYVTAWFVTAADRNEVSAQIRSLRSKLGDSESAPIWIETVRDVGYRMVAS